MNSKFMLEAIKEANLAAEKGEVPIGCVIVMNGKIIASAHNRCEELNDPTAHAEILAIKKASELTGSFRLTGAELYVTLEPCPMCAGAAINARIKEIVFGAYDPVKGALGSVCNLYSYKFPNIPNVYSGVEEKKNKKILQTFFKQLR